MRRYFALCGAIIGWALGIVLPTYARWPRLFYDPQAHRCFVARDAPPIPISYYGLLLWGILGAAGGAAAGAFLARRPRDESFGLAAAWALTALVISIAYYTFELWPQIGQ